MSGTTLEPSSNDHPEVEEVIEEGRDGTIESSKQFGFEDAFTEIPNQSSSAEGVLNLELDLFMKQLPHRHNRGGNLVTWKSKKQNVVARSSAEAEFWGRALGLCEALWFHGRPLICLQAILPYSQALEKFAPHIQQVCAMASCSSF
ncbi:hypothetical protein VitviT2T_008808 [Vitis vinifera]|uniref:Uncharacterized protein n=1 Tax=Vitis vinifera TaxID=29760 RepID=A0ABY9C619_VITVI|nr:hypothetical protein VitviT2T_008808 [Vitis vinifera]